MIQAVCPVFKLSLIKEAFSLLGLLCFTFFFLIEANVLALLSNPLKTVRCFNWAKVLLYFHIIFQSTELAYNDV